MRLTRLAVFLLSVLAAWLLPTGLSDGKGVEQPGKFVTRLLPAGGSIIAAAEDSGIWRLDLQDEGSGWRRLASFDSYALAVDWKGRLWAGTVGEGVRVFNGSEWRAYGILEGCAGERVFDVAADNQRSNLWIGHDHGLSLYSEQAGRGAWKSFWQHDGLPPGGIYSVAARKADGCVFAAGECGDVAFSMPPYGRWQKYGRPAGIGAINSVAVLSDGSLAAAGCFGISVGNGPQAKMLHLSPKPYENHARRVVEDASGTLWLATRHLGPVGFERGGRIVQPCPDEPCYAADVAAASGDLWCATYGSGMRRFRGAAGSADSPGLAAATAGFPEKASAEKAPAQPRGSARASFLGDDWLTQGDWLGRYGAHGAVLCAMSGAASDFRVGPGDWTYRAWLGSDCKKGDKLRYWVHWLRSADIPDAIKGRVLQNPILGGRRQAEWDDHSETYAMEHDGPHIFCTLTVPQGDHVLSLFFFNKDGHERKNVFRDYVITLKETPSLAGILDSLDERNADAEKLFNSLPALASARVRDFWNPVYKRFLVRGPSCYTFCVSRNGSFNTIISGVFLDPAGNGSRQQHIASLAELRRSGVEDGRFDRAAVAECLGALQMFGMRDRLETRRTYLFRLWEAKTANGEGWTPTAAQSRELRYGKKEG